MRCSSGRMSTSAAPSVSAAKAASGRSRRRPLRASASRSSMPGAPVGSESLLSLAADALARASAVSAPPRPRPPSGPSMATVSRGDQAVVGRRVIGHRHQRRRVRVNAGRRRAAAVRDVVHVAGPECDRVAVRQPPPAEPAARHPVLLDEAALGDRERPGRAAVIVPVGVLAAFPGQQPDVAGVRPVQRQVPAHVRVAHDQVRPQVAAGRQRRGDGAQLARGQPAGAGREAAERGHDLLLPLGADAPARFEAAPAVARLSQLSSRGRRP